MKTFNHRVTKPQRNNLEKEDKISKEIIRCAIEVHKQLGPGLLESIYEECLCKEFKFNEIKYTRQKEIPIIYKNIELPEKYRIDLVVEDFIITEIKCVENILPVHQAQLLTYLKLTGLRLGLILNFNSDLMKNGIKRVVL
ncbi:MAG: GxxExxY protein [bacterium (Candidatus Ratteibacteria) CG_4_9_14_3_um_filter_41_21]|uniref:GxxExxY protein n=2 Tax=Candidatus Ratteibacteria TaxID=2979319 RepID=A0A2M7YG40_9BACT|nr:MAG: GxxExxY protein [bacterium (Candidatus Ratteibacteria) CG15_BIG_FIL_POST_REV_8_21_14_020_41_12]PJA61932.1 MAG: GxxExxY protein [bacterium (Candidatus Ratteibacteria) CG_4_9_14_3_um_filter_41_21]